MRRHDDVLIAKLRVGHSCRETIALYSRSHWRFLSVLHGDSYSLRDCDAMKHQY